MNKESDYFGCGKHHSLHFIQLAFYKSMEASEEADVIIITSYDDGEVVGKSTSSSAATTGAAAAEFFSCLIA